MPTYEYECKHCRHRFERFQSINDKPVRKCPKCGKGVERLIGAGAGLLFKGSGFYITDYRSAGYKEKAKKEAGGGDGAKPSDAKKADKPAGGSKPKGKEE
jgi:putative FmdB family regulatory protein